MAPLLSGRLRRREPRFAPLVPVPPVAELPAAKLQGAARYLGTLDEQGARVVGQSLAARSAARLSLSGEALDVVRVAGSFRIPAAALRGASTADRFAGKPVADLLLVRWTHGEHRWETGFRMEPTKALGKALDRRDRRATTRPPDVGAWVRTISKMARKNEEKFDG